MTESKKPLNVIAGTPDNPLIIGDIEIDCYVLEDETRVLSQRGMHKSLGVVRGGPRSPTKSSLGKSKGGGDELPRFASQEWLAPYIGVDSMFALKSPISFKINEGLAAYGYPAKLLVDICDAMLEAEKQGATTPRQEPILDRARMLIRGFATVGIIALVDEATGYQRIREERALATILEKFIAKELQPWAKTFPYDFYEHIFRLNGWGRPSGNKRPQIIGHYTNDLVYERIAPGVLDELREKNPIVYPSGERRHRHHQWFTPEIGHPKLKEHLAAVIALMKTSASWSSFMIKLNQAFPKLNSTLAMPFEE